jgi:hypothetical protein
MTAKNLTPAQATAVRTAVPPRWKRTDELDGRRAVDPYTRPNTLAVLERLELVELVECRDEYGHLSASATCLTRLGEWAADYMACEEVDTVSLSQLAAVGQEMAEEAAREEAEEDDAPRCEWTHGDSRCASDDGRPGLILHRVQGRNLCGYHSPYDEGPGNNSRFALLAEDARALADYRATLAARHGWDGRRCMSSHTAPIVGYYANMDGHPVWVCADHAETVGRLRPLPAAPAEEAPQEAPASLSGLPLPVVTTDELLALLAPLTPAERREVSNRARAEYRRGTLDAAPFLGDRVKFLTGVDKGFSYLQVGTGRVVDVVSERAGVTGSVVFVSYVIEEDAEEGEEAQRVTVQAGRVRPVDFTQGTATA